MQLNRTAALLLSIVITTLLIVHSSKLEAKNLQGSKEQCKRIATKIDMINDKRRAGGSSAQMDKWRKKRNALSDKAYKLNCRKHGIIK
ncbi:hypothetical protein A3715_19140 [Oleiphilus sp. HI0009]|nr:hypothetical protein A3715_02725 [Oleiphilus sp. HI0009]KZX81007.1 hypothetical protein A3715_19140 [Oleiphilus sp. HI0009]KZY64498.1 hypothetical protein A3738_01690 [Oleiphilus sp. HI0066]KZY71654.1 hypothetical protein A3739_04490 [Oleiphilus sp. HI0067]KZZ57788.1 hypothetical protein A3762_09050 [Oleiphilus sp. HI0125]